MAENSIKKVLEKLEQQDIMLHKIDKRLAVAIQKQDGNTQTLERHESWLENNSTRQDQQGEIISGLSVKISGLSSLFGAIGGGIVAVIGRIFWR